MLKLQGCNPYPLSSYLKALGILRLIVEHRKDPNAKGYWFDDSFILNTSISQDELIDFFFTGISTNPISCALEW